MEKSYAKKEFLKHYSYIIKIIKFKTNQYDLDYDDTLNFVLEKLCDNDFKIIRSFRGESKFTTFLTIVVNNMIYRFARKKKYQPETPANITETPFDFLIRQQNLKYQELLSKNLNLLLNELDYKEKLVLEMKYFKGLNINQISKVLGSNRYETKKKLDSGLELLKDKIKKMCEN